jgi:gamma-glutamylaminecyclotransferase
MTGRENRNDKAKHPLPPLERGGIKVFVYGSLKRGFYNHQLLQGCRMWKAKAKGIDLHRGTAFPYAKRGQHVTHGELYEVDSEVLQHLDRLEGHPHFYMREQTEIMVGNKRVDAWIYLCPDAARHPLIESGTWDG